MPHAQPGLSPCLGADTHVHVEEPYLGRRIRFCLVRRGDGGLGWERGLTPAPRAFSNISAQFVTCPICPLLTSLLASFIKLPANSEAQCSVLGTGRRGRGPEPVAASSAEGPSTCLPQVLKLGLLVQYWAWRQDILDTSSFEGWVDLGGPHWLSTLLLLYRWAPNPHCFPTF